MNVEPVAGAPAVPVERGRAAGAAMVGLVAFVLVVAQADHPVVTAVLVVLIALVWGPLTWSASRRRVRRMLDDAVVVERPGPGGAVAERAAFERGLRTGVLLGLLLLVFVVALDSLVFPDVLVVWGFPVGLALLLGLQVRDVRAWERRTGLRLHLRQGGRVVAWTAAQATARVVAVRREPGPGAGPSDDAVSAG